MSCPLEIWGNNTHLKFVASNVPSPLRVLLPEKLTFSSVSGKDYSLCPSPGEEHVVLTWLKGTKMLGDGVGWGRGWGWGASPDPSLEDSIPQELIALLEAPPLHATLLVFMEKDTPNKIGGGRKGFADTNFNKYCECLGYLLKIK